MLINFREIPPANSGSGAQDTFEMFARDFFATKGYKIISGPGRGADGGIDLKVSEQRNISGTLREFFWLVSCKHYAHSGKAISPQVESNIRDRVEANGCEGFIGFYSRIPTTALETTLKGQSNKVEYRLFDNEKIEKEIIGFADMEQIFLRYFPTSYQKWKDLYFYLEPVSLFKNYFEQKYDSYRPFLVTLFGSVENLIKPARNFTSVLNLLHEVNYELVIEEELFDILLKNPMLELENIVLAQVEKKHGIKISKGLIAMNWNPIPEQAISFLFPNCLVINSGFEKVLTSMFIDFQTMLR